ncbi:MAG TPA: regulatory protein RecX [Acidothermaceae bacterium]
MSARAVGHRFEDPDDPPADPESVARRIALDLLTAAPRTRAQLAVAMAKRGVPDDVATQVLDRFTEVGLIDDAAFAAAWVRSRQPRRGLAPRALARELRDKGVAEPVVVEAIAAVDRDDVESTARTLARRKARASVGLPTEVRVRRLAGMLARKGYPSDVALRAVRDVLAEEQLDVADEFAEQVADQVAGG